jgi:hypothetical protein
VDELVLRFSDTVIPSTPAIKTKWERYSEYFDDQGQRNERMLCNRTQSRAGSEETEKQTVNASGVTSDESAEVEPFDMAASEAAYADYLASPSPEKEREAVEERTNAISALLEDPFDRFKPSKMGSEEDDCVKALVRRIFQYQPENHPQATDPQKDPWFASPEGNVPGISGCDRVSASHKERKGKRNGQTRAVTGVEVDLEVCIFKL